MNSEIEYVHIDLKHFKPICKHMIGNALQQQWSTTRAQTMSMISSVIDQQPGNKFEANRLKIIVSSVLENFDPHSIKIIKK